MLQKNIVRLKKYYDFIKQLNVASLQNNITRHKTTL